MGDCSFLGGAGTLACSVSWRTPKMLANSFTHFHRDSGSCPLNVDEGADWIELSAAHKHLSGIQSRLAGRFLQPVLRPVALQFGDSRHRQRGCAAEVMRIQDRLNVGKGMARNGRDFGHVAAGLRQARSGRNTGDGAMDSEACG